MMSCFFLISERVCVKLYLIIDKTFGRFFFQKAHCSWIFWWVSFNCRFKVFNTYKIIKIFYFFWWQFFYEFVHVISIFKLIDIELYIGSSSFILLISETSVTICPFNSYYCIFLCLYLFSWSVSRAVYRYFQRTKLLLDQHSLFYFLSSLLIFALIFIMSFLLCSLGLTCQVFFNFLKLMNSSLIFRLLI